MPSIQSFTMTYDALNEDGTFSEGDTITGKVTLALVQETTVKSLFVKAKGDATVRWTKKSGDHTRTYSSSTRFFKLKQFLIEEQSQGTVIPCGTHVYNFRFNIPTRSMPSSFRGSHGKIIYQLAVKLSRSWKMDRTIEKELHFVSKSLPNLQSMMSQQFGSTCKEMGFFSKGKVLMDVSVDRHAYAPGETMMIVAKIDNSSSSDVTPKFSLKKNVVYHAQSSTKHESCVVNKMVDNCIGPQTQKEVKCAMKIPHDQPLSIQNCDIISVEYSLKVYLDISFSFDPEVIFSVVILPPNLAPGLQPGRAARPYSPRAVGGPSNSDFHPPAAAMGPYPAGAFGGPSNRNIPPPAPMGFDPASPRSATYGHPGAQSYSTPPPQYPAQPAHMSGGYNHPVPQLPSPYGHPFLSPSSVLHPPPTAPTFHPPPSAPEINPVPPPSNISPTAPTYNLLPSAPMMNMDFLSQSDEPPPAYSLLFPSSATENSDAKK